MVGSGKTTVLRLELGVPSETQHLQLHLGLKQMSFLRILGLPSSAMLSIV